MEEVDKKEHQNEVDFSPKEKDGQIKGKWTENFIN